MTQKREELIPKIIVDKLTNDHGIFTLSPLAPGFGTTLGSALRRTLFAAEQGYAITHIKLHPAVPHEFVSIEGIKEDLQDIILNLKIIRFKNTTETPEKSILVSLKKQSTFTGKDIDKATSSFDIINPEMIICHMENKVNLDIELTIGKGKGYESAEEHKLAEQEYGLFAIDAIYAPVKNVTATVENILVGERTDYEKLIMEIKTDGTISPEDSLKNTINFLFNLFGKFAKDSISKVDEREKGLKSPQENKQRIEKLLKTHLSELGLTARVVNSLGAHGIEYLKDIVGKKVSDLLMLPNFGKKCMQDLEEFLKTKNISWDTDVATNS